MWNSVNLIAPTTHKCQLLPYWCSAHTLREYCSVICGVFDFFRGCAANLITDVFNTFTSGLLLCLHAVYLQAIYSITIFRLCLHRNSLCIEMASLWCSAAPLHRNEGLKEQTSQNIVQYVISAPLRAGLHSIFNINHTARKMRARPTFWLAADYSRKLRVCFVVRKQSKKECHFRMEMLQK